MKSLNFVIIGIPASINQESIVTAVALMETGRDQFRNQRTD